MNFTLYRTSVAYSSSQHHHEQEHRGVVCNIKMQTTDFDRSGNWFGLSITIYITFYQKKKTHIHNAYFDRSLKLAHIFLMSHLVIKGWPYISLEMVK